MLTHVDSKNTYSILGIAKPSQYMKENKYELIACGDYNSYAIINIWAAWQVSILGDSKAKRALLRLTETKK